MNPQAAQELVDMVMIEDFVGRRKALDVWVKRWVASVKLDHPAPKDVVKAYDEMRGPRAWQTVAKAALLDRMLVGMLNEEDQVHAFSFEVTEDEDCRVGTIRLAVILEQPHG